MNSVSMIHFPLWYNRSPPSRCRSSGQCPHQEWRANVQQADVYLCLSLLLCGLDSTEQEPGNYVSSGACNPTFMFPLLKKLGIQHDESCLAGAFTMYGGMRVHFLHSFSTLVILYHLGFLYEEVHQKWSSLLDWYALMSHDYTSVLISPSMLFFPLFSFCIRKL